MKQTNLAKNTILLSLGTIATKGINLIMIPLFSSWLSVEDYGTFDLICTYISLLIPFISMASADAMFRFAIGKEEKKEKSLYITCAFCLTAVNMIVVSSVLFVIYMTRGWQLAIPFIFLLLCELFCNHMQGFMRSTKQLSVYSISSIITTVGIALGVTIFVFVCQMGLHGMIWGYTLGYALGCVFLIIVSKYWTYLDFKNVKCSVIKEMIQYAYPLIPNNISWWIINVSDRTLISFFLGTAANGIYAIAYKIPNFCASIFGVFSISWQEAAVELVDSSERNAYYNLVYNNTVKTMISLCGGILSLNYFLFHYVFELRYFDASLYSPILITSVIFGALTQYFGGIQISLKRTKENGVTTAIGAIVNVVINIVLIQFIGLYAAALSTLISNIIVTLLRYFQLNKEIKFSLNRGSYMAIIYYIYLLFTVYLCSSLLISSINVLLACVMFMVFNKEFLLKIFRKKTLKSNIC